jgi:hypothetical protein
MQPLPISLLEQAINRARADRPASGAASALSPDVALLAGVYGRLIHQRADAIDIEQLSDDEQVVLLRWLAIDGFGAGEPPAG